MKKYIKLTLTIICIFILTACAKDKKIVLPQPEDIMAIEIKENTSENVKKITPYIHSGSLNVTNTVISVHNYTTDSLYLNSIEKVYYKDINEFSKKPYFSINQEYPEDE